MPRMTPDEMQKMDDSDNDFANAFLTQIETKLASIDGISTADAFQLGRLVRQYGEACAGKSLKAIMLPMLSALTEKDEDEPKRNPW